MITARASYFRYRERERKKEYLACWSNVEYSKDRENYNNADGDDYCNDNINDVRFEDKHTGRRMQKQKMFMFVLCYQ